MLDCPTMSRRTLLLIFLLPLVLVAWWLWRGTVTAQPPAERGTAKSAAAADPQPAAAATAAPVGAPDADIVDDDHPLLLQRAHEREPVLRIRPAITGQDAVGLGVSACMNIRPRALPHDLGKRAIGVDELAIGNAGDPQGHGKIVDKAVDDLLIRWYP